MADDSKEQARETRGHLMGRRRIYTSERDITDANIVDVLEKAFMTHSWNANEIVYLRRYYRGDQPILAREKDVRPEINNRIVENHAAEIVSFKVGYEFGAPVQFVQHGRFDERKQPEEDPALAELNRLMFEQDKAEKDISIGEDLAICGVGYRMCLPKRAQDDDDAPFDILTLMPENAFVVRSNDAYREAMLGVSFSVDYENSRMEIGAYTKEWEWRLIGAPLGIGLRIVESKPNFLGLIPIVEYTNNNARMGSFEPVVPLLDALNLSSSDRLNDISQFVQALLWFNNCVIDSKQYDELRDKGAVLTKDNGQNKASVEYLHLALDQMGTQTYKDDLYQSVLTISGVPDRMSNVNGNTGHAVMLAAGWSIAEAHARAKEPLFSRSEKECLRIILRILKDSETSVDMSKLKLSDIDVKFSRNRNDSLLVKTQGLLNQLEAGVHPRIALATVDLYSDPEMVFYESQTFMEKWVDLKQTDANNNSTEPKPAIPAQQSEGGF